MFVKSKTLNTSVRKINNPVVPLGPTSVAKEARATSLEFIQQETVLISLNVFALVALLLLQWLFRGITDPISFDLAAGLFILRIAEQAFEAWWLRARGSGLGETCIHWYVRFSIVANIIFAGVVSLAANSVDAHYSVLLVVPIIASAFRFSLRGVAIVVTTASAVAFGEIWLYFLRNPPVDIEEFFEATTVSLVYVVVGLVVWGLTQHMRRNAANLEAAVFELEQTRDKLVAEEKFAAVGRLASSVAHEIRNPVGMITSALATARKKGTADETRQELYDIAAKEAVRLEKVTADFLSYARPKVPDKKAVSVRETLDYIASLLRTRVLPGEKTIQIASAPTLEMDADVFQLHQALTNLGLNALEYVGQGGTVVLGGTETSDMTELYVQNSGPAIPSEQVAEIFEPFYTTRPTGTGLGLSISKNICRAHGGDLRLSHNTPGCVRFTMNIPRR